MEKFIFAWVCEVVAYWIFTINVLQYNSKYFQAPDGTNVQGWYNVYKFGFIPLDFGGIDVVYLIKNTVLIFMTIYYVRKQKAHWIDVLTYILATVFWLVSVIYFYDRKAPPTDVSAMQAWMDRYTSWNNNIYILPMIRAILDFILMIAGIAFAPQSYTAKNGLGLVWMDIQYLFIYLQLSGKVVWDNPFIMYVWIFMATILVTATCLCLLCSTLCANLGLKMAAANDPDAAHQQGYQILGKAIHVVTLVAFLGLAQTVLFLAWCCVVGSNKEYLGSIHILLLVACIIVTLSFFCHMGLVFTFRELAMDGTMFNLNQGQQQGDPQQQLAQQLALQLQMAQFQDQMRAQQGPAPGQPNASPNIHGPKAPHQVHAQGGQPMPMAK